MPGKSEVIEVETDDSTGAIVKVLLRHHHDVNNDICMAISMTSQVEDKFVVKTVWLNEKGDFHNSLDKARYYQVS